MHAFTLIGKQHQNGNISFPTIRKRHGMPNMMDGAIRYDEKSSISVCDSVGGT
jgi:hypothetical protein